MVHGNKDQARTDALVQGRRRRYPAEAGMSALIGPAKAGILDRRGRGGAARLAACAALGFGLFPTAVAPASAQSIASSLPAYQAVLRVPSVTGISAKSFSGVAFHPATRTLYVIDNDNANIYELDTAGALKRTLATSGFADPEGIVHQGDDYFLISEEGLANIVRLKLPRTGTGPVARSAGTALNLGPDMSNSGIEGVGYRASDRTAFAVKEIDPPRLYRITLDASGVPTASVPDQPFSIGGKTGDAADIAALEDGNFILVDQEGDRLEGYGPQGQALSTLKLGMSKPEGIAIDPASGTIYVVGEPMELAVFKSKTTAFAAQSSDNGWAVRISPGSARWAGNAFLLLSMPRRETMVVEYLGADGARSRVFSGGLGPGNAVLPLRELPPGMGVLRVSAGNRSLPITFPGF